MQQCHERFYACKWRENCKDKVGLWDTEEREKKRMPRSLKVLIPTIVSHFSDEIVVVINALPVHSSTQ